MQYETTICIKTTKTAYPPLYPGFKSADLSVAMLYHAQV